MNDFPSNPPPRGPRSDDRSQSQVEDLVQHAHAASAFEQRLLASEAIASEATRFVPSWAAHGSPQSAVEARGGARRVGPLRLLLTSAAACAALGITGFLFLRGTSAEERGPLQEEAVTAEEAQSEFLQMASVVPPEFGTKSQGDLVVAIYRGEHSRGDECGECWCVRRWSPHWGGERNVNELEESELVDDSIVRSCVGDPSRVIVIGLSGPEDALPKTDDQALQLSLCLIGQSPSTATTCVPSGLDYCMAAWSR